MGPALIAATLREISLYLDLEGEKFRARAYLRAAQSIEAAKGLERLIVEGRVGELPGVGPSIAATVVELAAGRAPLLDRLRAQWPAMVVELARLPGVGAPKARKLIDALSPASLDELADMADAGAVREVPGFGKSSEAKLRDAIRARHQRAGEMLLAHARDLTESLAAHLRAVPGVIQVVGCGAARRWIEVIDTVALAVSSRDAAAVHARLETHPLVAAKQVKCALAVAPPERFGAAMVIATGSAEHVVALAARADRPLDQIEGADEAAFYRALGLPFLPPEVRDGSDELSGEDFSDLVTLADIRGAVHCHTVASDGRHTVIEMARAAEERGLDYITITDHSQTAGYAGGLTEDRLAAQAVEIAEVQREVRLKILRGTESDILKDGSLDYPDDVLAGLDVVIASVHQRYKLDVDGMTARLVAMMRRPHFKIWGHALGRMLLRRAPVDVRFDEILDAIAESPCAVEINGDPHRLDLDPTLARRAKARGARFVLSVDAHATGQLDYIDNAVAMARRARLRPRDVLNTLPAEEFARAVRPT